MKEAKHELLMIRPVLQGKTRPAKAQSYPAYCKLCIFFKLGYGSVLMPSTPFP